MFNVHYLLLLGHAVITLLFFLITIVIIQGGLLFACSFVIYIRSLEINFTLSSQKKQSIMVRLVCCFNIFHIVILIKQFFVSIWKPQYRWLHPVVVAVNELKCQFLFSIENVPNNIGTCSI